MLLLSPDFTASNSKFLDSSLRYEKIKNSPPAKIRRWEDSKSNAKGVLIINSLSSGIARGFIKISESKSLSKATADARNISKMIEAEDLKKNYGGACAVLICNPNDKNFEDIKARFIRSVSENLNLSLKESGEFTISKSYSSLGSISWIVKSIETACSRILRQ